jgi:hypothetical protein
VREGKRFPRTLLHSAGLCVHGFTHFEKRTEKSFSCERKKLALLSENSTGELFRTFLFIYFTPIDIHKRKSVITFFLFLISSMGKMKIRTFQKQNENERNEDERNETEHKTEKFSLAIFVVGFVRFSIFRVYLMRTFGVSTSDFCFTKLMTE